MSENMYKIAAVGKFRFPTRKGLMAVEDLYDLSLPELDEIAKTVNKKVKESAEESFIKPVTVEDNNLKIHLDILKDVIATKLAEAEARKKESDNRMRRKRILEVIAEKQDESLKGKSLEDLTKMLDEIN